MPPPPERRWPRLVAGYLAFLVAVALAARPLYFSAAPSTRPGVGRLVVAVVVGVVVLHLLRIARAAIDAQPPSAFDAALRPPPIERRRAPLFVVLRDEVQHSVESQGYFEHVLWPRLEALAARRVGGPAEASLPKPAGRRLLRRGPSLAALRALIARIEEHP